MPGISTRRWCRSGGCCVSASATAPAWRRAPRVRAAHATANRCRPRRYGTRGIAMADNNGSVFLGAIWMLLISVLLFWLPGIGSLIAGIVGGKTAGGVGSALLAA